MLVNQRHVKDAQMKKSAALQAYQKMPIKVVPESRVKLQDEQKHVKDAPM